MIARSAFVQLRYSWALVALTTFGMTLVFTAPPLFALFGSGEVRWMGLLAWLGESTSVLPTLRRFGLSPLRAPLLPLVALFYTAATIGSALQHTFGRGLAWKRRVYRELRV
jgi:hypothetical protein